MREKPFINAVDNLRKTQDYDKFKKDIASTLTKDSLKRRN